MTNQAAVEWLEEQFDRLYTPPPDFLAEFPRLPMFKLKDDDECCSARWPEPHGWHNLNADRANQILGL